MMKIYGQLWVKEHGEEPRSYFNEWSTNINQHSVARILARARQSFDNGCRFPPPMGELVVWAETPTDDEWELMLTRVLSGNAKGEIEIWIHSRCGYNLKRCTEQNQMKNFKSYFRKAMTLKKLGQLNREEEEFRALPTHSSVSVTDAARNDFAASGKKHRLHDRIANLIATKKQR